MKKNIASLGLALLAAVFLLHPSYLVLGQGPLTPTPPGAPAPTMKTLAQIDAKLEKRIPISSAYIDITTSGSYYLTGNIAVGSGSAIRISADNVTLDLNGFTISSTSSSGSGDAIGLFGDRTNVTVKNGNIRGTTTFAAGTFTPGGFGDGISNSYISTNILISDLNIHGMGYSGINLGGNAGATMVVERCNVAVCGKWGVRAGVIRDSSAVTTGDSAIYGINVFNCSGTTVNEADTFARGIYGALSVDNSRGIAFTGAGVEGGSVNNSRGTSTSGAGLVAANATNCYGASTAQNGLRAATATACYGVTTSGSNGIAANPGTASFCRGSRAGGGAINAGIAIGCTVAAGTVSSFNKFLGTP